MTEIEQRIAIAEACGWTGCGPHPNTNSLVGFPEDVEPNMEDWEVVPDYLNDLNAMRGAEKTLATDVRWANYNVELFKVATNTNLSRAVNMPRQIFRALTATAPQRAEALLRALNLWKD